MFVVVPEQEPPPLVDQATEQASSESLGLPPPVKEMTKLKPARLIVPVFQILRYHGPVPVELNGPQDPGVVKHGGAELTLVGAGSMPHAPLATELPVLAPPMTEA
jgi:hypothetical protein